MSACPECCGPKDTPITYTYCFRCSEAKASTPNPLRAVIEERDRYREAIDSALSTTWQPDEEGGWGTPDDTLYPDRLAALAALQPHWQAWGDEAWSRAGHDLDVARKAEAERDEVRALLNEIEDICDEPLDERVGQGPTRQQQFARIEGVLRRYEAPR